MEKNNNSKNEPKSVQIKLKLRTLIIVSIVIVILLASNVFAGVMGYGNVFFMIKNLVTTGTLDGKDEIFSDKEITISYATIEILNDVELQVNKLQIRENNSTLIMRFKDKRTDKTNITLELLDSESNSLCSQTADDGEIQMNIDRQMKETEKLSLVVKDDNQCVKTLVIDLQSKEILVEGEEEASKISEIELKKYLGAFALLDINSNIEDKLVDSAKQIKGEILEDTGVDNDAKIIDGIVADIWDNDIKMKDGRIDVSGELYSYDKSLGAYVITRDGNEYRKGICLSVEDISYQDGIYTVKYIYGIIKQNDNIEAIKDTEYVVSTINLKYNPDAKYSKFKVVELVDSEMIDYVVDDNVIKDITNDKNEESNSSNLFDDETVKKAIEKYLEISGSSCASPEAFVESLGFKPEGKPDANYLIKTKIKYSKFKEKVLTYMTEELFKEKYSTFVKEQDGMLCYIDGGATGINYKIKTIEKINNNNYSAIVNRYEEDSNTELKIKFKIENYKGNCVIAEESSGQSEESSGQSEESSGQSEESSGQSEEKASTTNCEHSSVVEKADYSTGKNEHIELDGTHTRTCGICGKTEEEKHHFTEWNSINNNTAWTLWCTECNRYVYTEDYNEVLSSGYSVKNDNLSYKAVYTIRSGEIKAGEKYEVFYFKNDVLESYKGVTIECKNDGEIEFFVNEPGIYKIGMVSKENTNSANILGTKNIKFEAKDDGDTVAVYDINNNNIKEGKSYEVWYFINNSLESYTSQEIQCTEAGKLVFQMDVSGNYSVGMIKEKETGEIVVNNIKFELKADGSVEAK